MLHHPKVVGHRTILLL